VQHDHRQHHRDHDLKLHDRRGQVEFDEVLIGDGL